LRKGKALTWLQIKKAVEEVGVTDEEELGLIQCENGDGDHAFRETIISISRWVTTSIKEEGRC
jgi:hypothetical protein